jgi:hypothetical protein
MWSSAGSMPDTVVRRPGGKGRAALEQRARVKIAIAEAAGADPRHEIDRVRHPGLTPLGPTR